MKNYIAILIMICAANSYAQKAYITGLQKITFRTGPATENKILKMLESDSEVKITEAGETWSKIVDAEGSEGYVLNRFLTKEIPGEVKYKWLKNKFDKLEENHKELKTQLDETKTKLKETNGLLKVSEKNLADITKEFEDLKLGSTQYLELKEKYDTAVSELNMQNEKNTKLESRLSSQNMQWFLAGGGVLFLGWLIGLISRKKKYSTGLRL